MRIRLKHIAGGAVLAGALLSAQAASAQSSSCGVTGSALAAQSITYDPFAPNGLNQVEIPLILTRFSSGSAKTQTVNFVLTQPVGSPAYEVTYNGSSILYTEGQTQGHPQINSQVAGEVHYNYTGAGQSDFSDPLMLRVTVPANTDLSSGEPIAFDILYVCKGTGNLPSVNTPQTLQDAIKINVNVLSALQASYVGAVLDFGEVGDKTTAEVLGAPGTYTTPAGNNIRVASSGPYSVAVTSQNNYKLTFPGGNLGDTTHTLDYSAKFLGQTLTTAASNFTTTTCVRAGIGGVNLPISATLLEGGQTKTPSPNYSDVITVTVSPLLSGAAGQLNCPAL